MRLHSSLMSVVLVLLTGALLVSAAEAHPHVWVTVTSELVYAADGSITGVRHAWTFDEGFSSRALQDIKAKGNDVYTREELQPLAQTNMEAMKDRAYFTSLKSNGKLAFGSPFDYSFEYADGHLVLHFTLPLRQPLKSKHLLLEIVDPSYFIDFRMADDRPVELVDAPTGCKATLGKPMGDDRDRKMVQNAGEETFKEGGANVAVGLLFLNKVLVECP